MEGVLGVLVKHEAFGEVGSVISVLWCCVVDGVYRQEGRAFGGRPFSWGMTFPAASVRRNVPFPRALPPCSSASRPGLSLCYSLSLHVSLLLRLSPRLSRRCSPSPAYDHSFSAA